MIIDGYALPFYGRIRTRVDIDLAVAIKNQEELDKLCSSLQSNGFQTTMSSPKDPLIMILDLKEKVEMELWLRPHGIVFDAETLKRRRAKLDTKTDGWIVSPEDFITNKLARPDRSVVDEQDVKSVLVRQKQQLDYAYLKRRAKEAGVAAVLDSTRAR